MLAVLCAPGLTGVASAATPAFPFVFYLHDTTGATADTLLPSIYQFASTPLGSNSNIVLKAINSSTSTAYLGTAFAGTANGSTVLNPNFSLSGLFLGQTLPPGGSVVFTVNFSPTTVGLTTAYLQVSFQIQQGTCSFTSSVAASQCPSGIGLASTLNGTGTQPQLVLSYQQGTSGSVTLQPGASSPLNFGNVSLSASAAITFTLTNNSLVTLSTPAISVPVPTTYSSNPFTLNTGQLPATIAPGGAATFTVTFSPGQTGVVTTSLIIGSNTYSLQGAGIVVADIDALQVSYVDSTGVRGLPQAATPISFGQTVAGTTGTNTLAFTVMNPTTSYNAVSIPALSVSGAAFQLTALTGAAVFPVSLAPGGSITFNIVFSPPAAGTFTGSLAIGSRVFSLSGLSVSSPLPSLSLSVTPSPLTSQQQGTVTVQLASASSLNLVGTLVMTFTPLSGLTDDPAILFLANSARQISVSVASGQTTATYNGQSALAFQTGTTAGTITFAVTFPNTPAYTQSFTITPALVQITSATAVRSSPNLVVTLAGYDNTYSAGQLGFTFYDTSGNTIAPVQINATSNFQQLFFTNNAAGGAFQFSATFPVTGDVTKVGSVAVTVANSTGQATDKLNFQ
jgi:hypothetical protein